MPDTFTIPEPASTTYLATDTGVLQNAALLIKNRIGQEQAANLERLLAQLRDDTDNDQI